MDHATLVSQTYARTTLEPRQYQQKLVTRTLDHYHGLYRNQAGQPTPPARSVLVESPTGSGKTAMAMVTLKAMQELHDDVVVCWVAMRRNLLAQAARENQVKGTNVPISFVSMFDKNPEEAIRRREGKKLLLVVDECHHDATSSMTHLHNLLQPDYILGLTGTPFRSDRVKLCFDATVKEWGIHYLIQEGYLSRFDHYVIPKWDAPALAEFYLREPERWGKSVVFFHQLEHCFEFQRLVGEHGVFCDVVTGTSDRDEQLKAFEQNPRGLIANCMVLTEGFDCPELQTVFCRPSGKGTTVQMCGRVLRRVPGVPAKNIVQMRNSPWPFTKTALSRMQFVWENEEWRSLTVNPLLNRVHMNAMIAVSQTDVRLPQYLLDQKAKKHKRRLRF